MPRFFPLVQITRPHNCLGAVFASLVGGYLSGQNTWLNLHAAEAAVVVAMIVAAGNITNDLSDLEIDRLNKRFRPLPSGRLSLRAARRTAICLLAGALLLAWSLGLIPLGIAALAGLLAVLYSYYLKNTVLLGNFTVGLLSGATILFGSQVSGHITQSSLMAFILISLFVFMREILKTIADRESDRQVGLQTVATVLGEQSAMRLFHGAVLMFVMAALAPWSLQMVSSRYLSAIGFLLVLPTLGIMALLIWKATTANIRFSLRLSKLLWFSGLLALIFLR